MPNTLAEVGYVPEPNYEEQQGADGKGNGALISCLKIGPFSGRISGFKLAYHSISFRMRVSGIGVCNALNVEWIVRKFPVYMNGLELCPPIECGISIGVELNVHIVEAAGLNDGSVPQLYGGPDDAVFFNYINRIVGRIILVQAIMKCLPGNYIVH